MAKEAYYFSHDSNARNDDKIIAMRMRHGMEGYGIYWTIIERLRECDNYTSVKDYNVISYEIRVSADKVKSIVEDYGLFTFTDDGKRFYSESLNRRMDIKEEKSEKAREKAKKRWAKQNNDTTAMLQHSYSNADAMQVKESKVKEIKVKEIKEEIIKEEQQKNENFQNPSVQEIPPREEPPPFRAAPPLGEIDIDECAMVYRSQQYRGTRETVCMANYIDMDTLLDWLDAFVLEQKGQGKNSNSVTDFAKHFFRWMKFQDMKVNPKSLIHKQKEVNVNRANNTRNKAATGGKVLNADYKADLLKRMAGNTD